MLDHLLPIAVVTGIVRVDGSLVQHMCLQGVDYGDIQSCVLATYPARDQDISWSSIRAWDEGPLFLSWAQDYTRAVVEEVVPELVVSISKNKLMR